MSLNHTKQKSWPQRLLALLAAVVLCAALPAAALAEENTASIQTQVSETDEDIPWSEPPQSTPETGRPDPAVPTPPPQDPATPETAQTGEHLEGYSLSLGETITIYFYVTLPEDTPQDAAMQFTLPDSTVTQVAVADAKQVEVNGKSCTAFPCQVAAKQLTDDIEARMVVNGKYGPVYTYTVKDYLNYLLEHDYRVDVLGVLGVIVDLRHFIKIGGLDAVGVGVGKALAVQRDNAGIIQPPAVLRLGGGFVLLNGRGRIFGRLDCRFRYRGGNRRGGRGCRGRRGIAAPAARCDQQQGRRRQG